MKRFIEGEDRSQSNLILDRLGDYIAEDNPVRVTLVFIEEPDRESARQSRYRSPGDWQTRLQSGDPFEDLCVWLPQSHPVHPLPGARGTTQCWTDMAHVPADIEFQDNRRRSTERSLNK